MGTRDSRRVLGPEKSVSHTLLTHKETRTFLQDNGTRWDGRAQQDPRKIFMSVGMISQAKGSSYLEIGNTKVCCGVYGPKDVQRGQDFKMAGQVLCSVKMAPFSCPIRLSPQPDGRQQEMSRQLKDALEAIIVLEKFPKSQIDVYVTVIEDDGSLLSACITAAGLALCHANIDVFDMVVGTSVLWHDSKLYLDPTREEENHQNEGVSQLTLGMIPKHAGGQVCLMVQGGGQESPISLSQGLDTAVDMCNRIHALARKTLLEHLETTLPSSSSSSS